MPKSLIKSSLSPSFRHLVIRSSSARTAEINGRDGLFSHSLWLGLDYPWNAVKPRSGWHWALSSGSVSGSRVHGRAIRCCDLSCQSLVPSWCMASSVRGGTMRTPCSCSSERRTLSNQLVETHRGTTTVQARVLFSHILPHVRKLAPLPGATRTCRPVREPHF